MFSAVMVSGMTNMVLIWDLEKKCWKAERRTGAECDGKEMVHGNNPSFRCLLRA